MMKRYLICIATGLAVLTSACKKEYDLNLNASNKSFLVVEGMLTDQTEPQLVKLSRTVSYQKPEEPVKVDNASVTLTYDGNTVAYTLLSPGTYAAPAGFKGTIGKSYHLKIVVDGNLYEATSVMTRKQLIDSICTKRSTFDNSKYDIRASFQENTEKGDYLLFKYAINGVLQDSLTRWSYYTDNATNGEHFVNSRIFGDINGEAGDDITVYTYSIEKVFYDFIKAARSSQNEPLPFFPPPGAAINGNISNGALGYFQATAVTKASCKFIKQ